MKTLSLDLRERIVGAYDAKEGTREEVAKRFRVSLGMVKKLLGQREKTGDIGPRHRFSGRKAKLLPNYRKPLGELIKKEPDLTLAELRDRLKMGCTVPALHHVLKAMGLTYKKRLSMQLNRNGPISPRHVKSGNEGKAGSIRRGWSSSTSQRPKPI